MCEEVQQPATQVPKAMVGALIMNMICGFIFIVPLMFVLPPIIDVISTSQPLPLILSSAIGNEGGAFALTIPIIVLGLLCGTSCTTACSRCTWAFARDNALPGSRYWKVVNKKLDVPLNAMLLCMVIEIALGCIYFGSTAAFNAFIGVGVIFLTLSYVSPIVVSLLGGRKHLKMGAWNFGAFGVFCNCVTIGESHPYLPFS
jgi:amino acid transporter